MLYGYETKSINLTVKCNIARFPESFRFQLTKEEASNIENLRFQFETSSPGQYGGRRCLPFVFTEQDSAMLSGLLKSEVAVQVSIGIMQAFVEMRRIISFFGHTFERLTKVEYKLLEHDKRFDEVFDMKVI